MTRTSRVLVAAIGLASLGVAIPFAQPTVPTPQSVIGFEPCADYKLATYEQIAEYFRTLAAASSRPVRYCRPQHALRAALLQHRHVALQELRDHGESPRSVPF